MKLVTFTATEPGLHTIDFERGTVEGPSGQVANLSGDRDGPGTVLTERFLNDRNAPTEPLHVAEGGTACRTAHPCTWRELLNQMTTPPCRHGVTGTCFYCSGVVKDIPAGVVVFHDASNSQPSIKHPDGTVETIEDLLSSRDDWRGRALGR